MKPRIVVIDDDPSACESLVWLLEAAGFPADGFISGHNFLDSTSPENRPACVIVDVDMPDVSGIELIPLLRRRYLGIPIVVITGYPDGRMAKPAARLEPDGFLTKPLDIVALLELMDELVHPLRIPPNSQMKVSGGG